MMDHWHHNYGGGEIKGVGLPRHRLKVASYLLSDDVQTLKIHCILQVYMP